MTKLREDSSWNMTGIQLGVITAFAGGYCIYAYPSDPWLNQSLYGVALALGTWTVFFAVARIIRYRRRNHD